MVIEILLGVSVVLNIGLLIGVRNNGQMNSIKIILKKITSTDEIRSQVQMKK